MFLIGRGAYFTCFIDTGAIYDLFVHRSFACYQNIFVNFHEITHHCVFCGYITDKLAVIFDSVEKIEDFRTFEVVIVHKFDQFLFDCPPYSPSELNLV